MMATSGDTNKMRVFGDADKWAFHRIAERDTAMAQMWLDKLEPMMWNNYLSKAEAEAIVAKFENEDGTTTVEYTYDDTGSGQATSR